MSLEIEAWGEAARYLDSVGQFEAANALRLRVEILESMEGGRWAEGVDLNEIFPALPQGLRTRVGNVLARFRTKEAFLAASKHEFAVIPNAGKLVIQHLLIVQDRLRQS